MLDDVDTAKVWNAGTGELIHTFEGHDQLVNSAVFSKDEDRILTASDDKTAKLWNADTGELIRSFEGHNNKIESAVFSKNEDRILTASWGQHSKTLEC